MSSQTAAPDRRQDLVSAVLVAAVVVVLGWGAGLGHQLTHDIKSSQGIPGSTTTTIPGTTTDAAPVVTAGSVIAAGGTAVLPVGSGGSTPTTPVTPAKHPAPAAASPSAGAPSAAATSSPAPGGGATVTATAHSCSNLADAVADPLVTHLDKGHLEASPGQQVTDLLDLDQYAKTHTVLVESMVAPLMALLPTAIDAANAFWVHVQHGHLETSPGQQVADILAADQYVKTHTVLVENMLSPVLGVVMGTSC